MLPIIPILIAIAGGAYVAYTHWDEIVAWFSDVLPKIEEYFKREHPGLAHAAQVVGEKVKEVYAQIKHKIFFEQDNKWYEQSNIREVPLSEVPPHIRAKIQAQKEAEITEETRQLLPPMAANALN